MHGQYCQVPQTNYHPNQQKGPEYAFSNPDKIMRILQRAPMLGVFIALISGLALYDKAGLFALIFGVPLIFIGVMFCSYEDDYPEQWRVFLFALVFV